MNTKHELFIQAVVSGKSHEQAAIAAGYPASNARVQGSKLAARYADEIKRRLDLVGVRAGITRETWLTHLTTEATTAPEASARVAALREIGKAQKYYPAERHEVTGKEGGPLVIEVVKYADPATE